MAFKPHTIRTRSMRAACPRLLVACATTVALALAGAAPASAEGPWWRIGTEVVPTYLPPGGEGQIIVAVSNLGDGTVDGSKAPVTIADKLPAGLTATSMTGNQMKCSLPTLQCTYTGVLDPYQRVAVTIKVKVEEPPGTVTSLPDEMSVEGGGAQRTVSVQDVTINGAPTPFGIQAQGYELAPSNEDGTPASQAGSHPFQLTTTLVLNQANQPTGRQPVTLPKDLGFDLPAGLVGNPNAAAQCPMTVFYATAGETGVDLCPPTSVLGVATVTANEPLINHVFTATVPLFNLVPPQGEPARFGFEVLGKVFLVVDTSVRTGGDYSVAASVKDATQVAGLLSSQVTLWGVPGDPRHNQSRGWECIDGGAFQSEINKPCPASSDEPQEPFLMLPTSCPANPASERFTSSMEADSWAQPGSFQAAEYSWLTGSGEPLGLEGCSKLPFTPSIGVAPDVHNGSTPTGLSVNVHVPQTTTLEAEGLAEADVRDTTVTFPEGVQVSPSAANGLEACSQGEVGYMGLNGQTQTQEFTSGKPSCPDSAKVGVVHIRTPLLSHELEGAMYLATPAPNGEGGKNPFGSLVAFYLVAEDPVSGVLVKLAGEGKLDPTTGQITTIVQEYAAAAF